jgi:hypothetical protein
VIDERMDNKCAYDGAEEGLWRLVFFFLNRGRVAKDPDASFIHSGGVTFYIRAYLKKRNYNKGLIICN